MKSKAAIISEILDAAANLPIESQSSSIDQAEGDESIEQVLRRRLPDVQMVTCNDLGHLGINCCETCHTFYPETEMGVVSMPDGQMGWLCCAVEAALNPTRRNEPNPVMDAWRKWTP
jgi:hypothetical protein